VRRVLGFALGAAAAALLVGGAGPSGAARLNWEGTLTSTTGSLPPLQLFGGGVATVNGSSRTIPAHLATQRLEASRGGIEGTATNIITDPDVAGNGIAAIILVGQGGTGTLAPISGVFASQPGLTQGVLSARGLSKRCLLSTVCTDFLPLMLTQPTTNGARYQVNTATPNQVRTNLALGSNVKVSILTELLIHFIPEPGLKVLLGSGVLASR
jgi:hypothetical protein